MTPSLEEMTCTICGAITDKDIIAKLGMCEECNASLEDANKAFEEGDNSNMETDEEMKKTIEQYKRRQEYMAEYNARPEIAAKRKEYMKGRAERQKALVQKAKDLGLL